MSIKKIDNRLSVNFYQIEKSFPSILILFFLFFANISPQNRVHQHIFSEKLIANSLAAFHKLIVSDSLDIRNIKFSSWENRTKLYGEGNYENYKQSIRTRAMNYGFLLTEDIYQDWHNSKWVNNFKISFSYDRKKNQTEKLYYLWDGSTWMYDGKDLFTYNENNNLIEELCQDWDGSAWVNSLRISYTYDGNSNLVEVFKHEWNSKVSYTFDGNNNLIEELSQTWDGSAIVNHTKHLYTYDVNKNMIEFVVQIWKSSVWVNSIKDSITYKENNNKIEFSRQNWDGSSWGNYYKGFYTYDKNNNLIEFFKQIWKSTAWINYDKSFYTYDANNNSTEYLYQYWDKLVWLNQNKTAYVYDMNNNKIEEINRNWVDSTWVNVRRYLYRFATVTSINENHSSIYSYKLSNNYPNPFNPSTTIKYSLAKDGFVTLKVYNILGKEVATLVNENKLPGNYEVKFNGSSMPSGIYFYRLQCGSFIETRKLMLVK